MRVETFELRRPADHKSASLPCAPPGRRRSECHNAPTAHRRSIHRATDLSGATDCDATPGSNSALYAPPTTNGRCGRVAKSDRLRLAASDGYLEERANTARQGQQAAPQADRFARFSCSPCARQQANPRQSGAAEPVQPPHPWEAVRSSHRRERPSRHHRAGLVAARCNRKYVPSRPLVRRSILILKSSASSDGGTPPHAPDAQHPTRGRRR